MKTGCWVFGLSFLLSHCVCAQTSPLTPTGGGHVGGQHHITERGPHHRVWARAVFETNRLGQIFVRTNSYVELESGMHYWEDGQWKESQELIETYPDGAIARRGPHKAIFANDLNTVGAVDLQLPDGQRLRSHILGLSYFDSTTGQSVLIAQLTNSAGWWWPPNQVIYTNAFAGLNADVRYTYRKSGLSQDVILREQPAPPAAWGFNPATTRLQILTEFLDPPVPRKRVMAAKGTSGLADERLDFGTMKIGPGKAFSIGSENEVDPRARVVKQWVVLEGRTFLVEEVPFTVVEPQLRALAEKRSAFHRKPVNGQGENVIAALGAGLPRPMATRKAAPVQVAKADVASQPGFVLDYEIVMADTDFTFKGDMTYYCTNTVYLEGTTVVEGGAVVKFSTNWAATLSCWDGLDCRTAGYRPAVFTAKDDDSVGELIAGSTGNPTGYYGGRALYVQGINTPLRHLRFAHQSIALDATYGETGLSDLQFVKCQYAVINEEATLQFRNCLFHKIAVVFKAPGWLTGEHLSFNQCGPLFVDWGYGFNSTLALTNCLGVLMTNWGSNYTLTTNSSALFTNDPGLFQTVGAGAHYLANDSPYRDAGTTNINAALLADLAKKTTYPPVEITTNITGDTILSPRAFRDTDLPDLGYHYEPLDYVPYFVNVNHAALMVEAGTALGFRGWDWGDGLTLGDAGQLITTGQPNNPCHFARYNSVQEQATTNWSSSYPGPILACSDTDPITAPTVNCRFTEFSQLGGEIIAFGDGCLGTFTFRDCAFRGGNMVLSSAIVPAYPFTVNVTNCLFERTATYMVGWVPSLTVSAYNNLFWNGSLTLNDFDTSIPENGNTVNFQDNLFFGTAISQTTNLTLTASYNGYLTNCDRLTPTNANDVVLTNLTFETGVLGRYYQPADSPLINAGSRTADEAGLYHFTTQTNQVKEGNTTNDMGFHYVAVDGNGNPADSDGDGLADYLEDANGNGSYASGDLANWEDADTDYDGRSDGEEASENTDPLDAASFTPTRLAFFRFNDAAWSGERGQLPLATNALQSVDGWITSGVQLTNNSALLKYQTVEADGTANINLRSGTVRFWFKSLWNSGTGTGDAAKLLEVGSRGDESATNGWWSLYADDTGDTLYFVSQTNNAVDVTNLTASVTFTSNRWCQLVLTYTNGAVALYTNGVLCASDSASLPYPPLATRTNGFTIGSDTDGNAQADGVFEDLETFNYPLSANDVLENFQFTEPPMLIPDLKMWLKADADAIKNAANQVHPWRDRTPNQYDAVQPTLNNRPIFVTNVLDGKPAIYFPGTNNYFKLTNVLFNSATEAETFVLLKADSATPTNNRGLWYLSQGGSRYPNTDGTVQDSMGSLDIANMPVPALAIDQAHIYNVAVRSNEWTCRFNGVAHFTRNTTTLQFNSTTLYLGNGAGTYFAGHIGEVLIFSRALGTTERLAVESYLSQRFNLVTNLPPPATNLSAWAVSTNQISLTWSNALSNTNLTFIVQRKTDGGDYGNVGFVRNGLSYLDSDLATGTQYFYRIKSFSYSGESAFSVETNITTLSSGPAMPMASMKLWLKADGGHGYGPVNCWVDQTTNNNSAYFTTAVANRAPTWSGFNTNGNPAIFFEGTNAFRLPAFLASATQAEAMVAVRSFGPTDTNWVALWLMGGGATECRYPYTNGFATNNYIEDNFGRATTDGFTLFASGLTNMALEHLYNPMSKSGEWSARVNNVSRYTTTNNHPAFQPLNCRLGRGDSTISKYLVGEICELMIFDRELTGGERDIVATNYFRKRFNLK